MRKKIILAVDDEQYNLEFIKSIFEDDFEVITAKDGEEGLQKAHEKKPDIIILDVQMPQKDGFTTFMEHFSAIAFKCFTAFPESSPSFAIAIASSISTPISVSNITFILFLRFYETMCIK
jgi:response regulator RpfG family c-di-GMP phosphodiesterase